MVFCCNIPNGLRRRELKKGMLFRPRRGMREVPGSSKDEGKKLETEK
jgi:hypothetical protein